MNSLADGCAAAAASAWGDGMQHLCGHFVNTTPPSAINCGPSRARSPAHLRKLALEHNDVAVLQLRRRQADARRQALHHHAWLVLDLLIRLHRVALGQGAACPQQRVQLLPAKQQGKGEGRR